MWPKCTLYVILTSRIKSFEVKLCCIERKLMVSHTDILCIRELQADNIQNFGPFRLIVIFHKLSQLQLAVCLSCDINNIDDFICTWKKKADIFRLGVCFGADFLMHQFSAIYSVCWFHKVCNKAFERHSCRAANHKRQLRTGNDAGQMVVKWLQSLNTHTAGQRLMTGNSWRNSPTKP